MDCMRDDFEQGKLLDGRFLTISPLNHGSFGMVFSAKDTWTGADVAIKCTTRTDAAYLTTACPAAIATDDRSEELEIHSRLPVHPNIVNLVHHFHSEAHQYMVLELCNKGDLYEAIRVGKGPLETEHVRDFMMELVNAVDHIHSNGVYHRDIKPENIFLTSLGAMKLGDFGLATSETWSTEFAVGSDRYMAPEQYDASVYGFGYSPASADIWAIGIVLLNVLFQRNPFASPTMKDPLFADFARDRQSLFDVFPTMSQDTYNILVHSLALDPANRSLGAVREALKAVVSFTTDDESLDEFCATEQYDMITTAGREPLRTPSVSSPNMNGDSFPWTSALLKTPQKTTRQLSTIHDEESEMFPGSAMSDWQYVDADEASLSSNLDSGLGMSYKSTKSTKSFKSTTSSNQASNIVGSLPISFSKPNKSSSPYGAGFSKSWSDLMDEDLEMEGESETRDSIEDAGLEIDRVSTAKPSTPQLRTISIDDCGSATPRQVLAETDVNARSASPMKRVADVDMEKPEGPKRTSSILAGLDKWAMLGNLRRAKPETTSATATTTPQKSKYSDAFASFAPFSINKKQKSTDLQSKSRDRAPSWRQGSPQRLRSTSMNKSQVWERKEYSPIQSPHAWELDNNWREHKPPALSKPLPALPSSKFPAGWAADRKSEKQHFLGTDHEDGDVEWIVGGWKDFNL